jgi:hypothetical protein
VLVLSLPGSSAAQLPRDSSTAWLIAAGSEGERYLRVAQVAGLAGETHWSVRPFATRELHRMAPSDSAHPWAGRLLVRPDGGRWVRAVQPEVTGIFNSRFPYGMNDGPVWAGRGLTAAAVAGVQGDVGPVSFTLAPQLFRSQNAEFPIAPTGRSGPQQWADAVWGFAIDLPQRFGDGAYQRLDPGQSSISLHLRGVSLGVSTANEVWGPAAESPFLLGANAAGFGHLFLGTDRPLVLGPVSASARLIAGRLEQSEYSPVTDIPRRYLTGAIVSLGTRYLPGLELGVARVFQSAWPDSGVGIGDILLPLIQSPLKGRIAPAAGELPRADNQLASLFGRWVFPASGVEVYGELGREDHSHDGRDLALEPDHDLTYMLGFQRVWRRGNGRLLAVRGELLNSAVSHLVTVRPQAPPYVHDVLRQGHTQLGQLLGAPGGFGGGATMFALDWYAPEGRRSVTWRRLVREPTAPPAAKDVLQSLAVDWLLFRSRVDLVPEAAVVYNLDRDGAGDAVNLRGALTGRLHW